MNLIDILLGLNVNQKKDILKYKKTDDLFKNDFENIFENFLNIQNLNKKTPNNTSLFSIKNKNLKKESFFSEKSEKSNLKNIKFIYKEIPKNDLFKKVGKKDLIIKSLVFNKSISKDLKSQKTFDNFNKRLLDKNRENENKKYNALSDKKNIINEDLPKEQVFLNTAENKLVNNDIKNDNIKEDKNFFYKKIQKKDKTNKFIKNMSYNKKDNEEKKFFESNIEKSFDKDIKNSFFEKKEKVKDLITIKDKSDFGLKKDHIKTQNLTKTKENEYVENKNINFDKKIDQDIENKIVINHKNEKNFDNKKSNFIDKSKKLFIVKDKIERSSNDSFYEKNKKVKVSKNLDKLNIEDGNINKSLFIENSLEKVVEKKDLFQKVDNNIDFIIEKDIDFDSLNNDFDFNDEFTNFSKNQEDNPNKEIKNLNKNSFNFKLNDIMINAVIKNQHLSLKLAMNNSILMINGMENEIKNILKESGFKNFSLVIKDREKRVYIESKNLEKSTKRDQSKIDVLA